MAYSGDDLRLIRAARQGVHEFELEYNRIHGHTPGPTLANRFQLYSNLDENASFSSGSSSSSSSSRGGGGYRAPNNGGTVSNAINSVFTESQFQYSTEKVDIGGIAGQITGGLADLFTNPLALADKLKSLAGGVLGLFTDYYKQQNDLLETINQRTLLSGELSDKFRQDIINISPQIAGLGVSFEDLTKQMARLVADSGRFKIISSETILQLSKTSKAFFDNLDEAADAFQNFQNISRGVADASLAIDKVGKGAIGLGLNAKETVKTLNTNISQLNNYGFRNGIDGLTRMVEKAQSLKMELQPVYDLAEKLFDPEKAIETTAQLSAIGGAFGDLTDPLRSMYDATNNIEGLQDSIIGAAKALVTFNTESKTFEITGANLRRARDEAQALGINFKDLTNLGIQAAQKAQAVTDILSTGLVMNPDDREFLSNLSQIKDGRMVIEVPEDLRKSLGIGVKQTSIALDQLTSNQIETLKREREDLKTKTTDDVIRAQQSDVHQIMYAVNELVGKARVSAGKSGGTALKEFGFDPDKLTTDFHNFVEKTGGDTDKLFKTLDGELKKTIPDIKNLLGTGIDEIKGFLHKGMDILGIPVSKVNNKQGGATSNSNVSTVNYNHNHNFKSDIVTSTLYSQVMKEFISSKDPKSYLYDDMG